jgi:hypothetical protein
MYLVRQFLVPSEIIGTNCVLLYINNPKRTCLTLNLLMSYIYWAPCKARNFNIVYIWTYVWQRWKPSLSICCIMF